MCRRLASVLKITARQERVTPKQAPLLLILVHDLQQVSPTHRLLCFQFLYQLVDVNWVYARHLTQPEVFREDQAASIVSYVLVTAVDLFCFFVYERCLVAYTSTMESHDLNFECSSTSVSGQTDLNRFILFRTVDFNKTV